ncbi:restriction endonuclease [Gimesia maris]|uniref:restriction endonuclease n=1 Tax=Gimesia maris TaxID=122 RepID=UPI0030DC90DF|tara:strand:- start:179032 stop:180060 length:1029 start_codon:yes stop_codon:yes gene_type:complete
MNIEELREQTLSKDDLVKLAESLPGLLLEDDASNIDHAFESILYDLLIKEGYNIREREPDMPAFKDSLDFYAYRKKTEDSIADSVGFGFAHSTEPIDNTSIESLIETAEMINCDRFIFLGPLGFTEAARVAAAKTAPATIELFDVDRIREWIVGKNEDENQDDVYQSKMYEITSRFAHETAMMLAESPEALDAVNWLQLEQVLERVFKELGFDVELTRESKDGGKDHILRTYTATAGEKVFYVELKHWRCGKPVRKNQIKRFTQVVLQDNAEKGFLLSTSGFAKNAFEALVTEEHERIRVGGSDKIHRLCSLYKKHGAGIWQPPTLIENILIENTDPIFEPE